MNRSDSPAGAMIAVLRAALRREGWTARRLAAHFTIGEATAKRWLAGRGLTLERLALIDRLPGGRARPLIDRTILWRKAPMRALFEARMKPQFLSMDFSAEGAVFVSEVVKLSAHGAAELAEMLERLRREIQALAERDRERSLLPRRWYAMLGAMRELDSAEIRGTVEPR